MKKLLLIFAATILLSNISNASSHSESLKQGIKEHAAFNFIEAFEILSPLAANGDDEAQLYLGVMYKNGEWVERGND